MLNVDVLSRPAGSGVPMLLVHGGAWNIPEKECAAHKKGLEKALLEGKKGLMAGKSAFEVVVDVVAVMESDGAFDAGKGAVLNRDGEVELDAGVMEGSTLKYGAVAGIQHFEHPIKIAQQIVERGERQYCFLAGIGAEKFALASGFAEISNKLLICTRELQRYEELMTQMTYHTSHPFLPDEETAPRGTVGCVALDKNGTLAAATSTGGTPFRPAGRVGDSPLPGCGYYASRAGAASATGWGEAIASVSLCYGGVRSLEEGTAEAAARKVINQMGQKIENLDGQGATGGIILLSKKGEGAFAFSAPKMARGGWMEGGELWMAV